MSLRGQRFSRRSLAFLLFVLLTLDARCAVLNNWSSNSFPTIPLTMCFTGSESLTNGVPSLWKILFNNGVWLAAGTGPCYQDTPSVFMVSSDGHNWQRSNNPGHYNGFTAAIATPSGFFGVGWAFVGFVASFFDGVNWFNAPPVDGTQPGAVGFANAVSYGLGRHIVVGGSGSTYGTGAIMYSSNGIAWTPAVLFARATNAFTTVAFGNGVFCVGGATKLFRSTDGRIFVPSVSGIEAQIICFGNGRFVAAGSSNLAVSTNGVDWVTTALPTAGAFQNLIFSDGAFLATAGRDVAQSLDGFDWSVHTNALPRNVFDIAYGNGLYIAVSGQSYFTPQPMIRLTATDQIGKLWVSGETQRYYDIQAARDLTSTNWQTVSRIALSNSPQSWLDPVPQTNSSRFYRAILAF